MTTASAVTARPEEAAIVPPVVPPVEGAREALAELTSCPGRDSNPHALYGAEDFKSPTPEPLTTDDSGSGSEDEDESGEDDPPLGGSQPLTSGIDSPTIPPPPSDGLSHAVLSRRIGALIPIILRRRSELLRRDVQDSQSALAEWLRRLTDGVIHAGDCRVWDAGGTEEVPQYTCEEDFTAHEVASLAAHAVLYLEAARKAREVSA